jgi:hypothetical protein
MTERKKFKPATPCARSENKVKKNLMLTPTAIANMESWAFALNLSLSEYLERFGRQELPNVIRVSNEEESKLLGESLAMRSLQDRS